MWSSMPFYKAFYLLFFLALISQIGTCEKYSAWMLESIISRGEGISATDGLLGEIQKGLFQEALRAAIGSTKNTSQAERWSDYLDRSVQTGINDLLNATADAKAPLDRFCVGRSLLQQKTHNKTESAALKALRRSVDLQLRNANGGLWYFSVPPPPFEPYGNLSFSDGMYGFAPFATLYGHTYHDPHLNLTSAYHQLQLIHTHCRHNATGLLVHGYDASRRAPWADPVTGASPVVWGRSLAWYTVGLVDALEIASAATAAASSNPTTVSARRSLVVHRMRTLFHQLAVAEIAALRHSVRETGRAGVWQVVDMPGRADNFVEASATALLTYALAKGIRLGFFLLDEEEEKKEDDDVADEIQSATYARPRKGSKNALHILRATYDDLVAHFVVPTHNNTLNFTGTSTIASLSVPKPDYYYYTHRNLSTNSLIGTSAFVLASLEMERMR